MLRPAQETTCNSLLKSLAEGDYALLRPHLERVTLDKGHILAEPNEPMTHVYFPESALGSIVAISPEGVCIEASMIGCEGLVGVTVVHGDDRTPHRVLIQVEGDALRIATDSFRTILAQCPPLMGKMQCFAQVVYIQTAYTALSNAHHGIEERLARWLLMCHDRSRTDEMPLTHEFLSIMLDVRRPSVTTALHVLEGMCLIRAHRGKVIMRDRAGLEEFARDAYGIPEAEYARLIGPMPRAEALAAAVRMHEASQKHIDRLERGTDG